MADGNPMRVPYRALAVATGRYHSCALLDDHNVKCWGNNEYGQLGLGDTITRGKWPEQMGDALPFVDLGAGRTATAIAAGRYATCATLDNQSLKCWGWAGLIGLDEQNNRGDGPGEMGDNLPALNLGPGRSPKQVAIGTYRGCALLDDASIKCWDLTGPAAASLPAGARSIGVAECDHLMCALLDDGSVMGPISAPDRPAQRIDLGAGVTAGHGGSDRAVAGDGFQLWPGSGWRGDLLGSPGLDSLGSAGHTDCQRMGPHLRSSGRQHRQVLGQKWVGSGGRRSHPE